MTKGKETKKPKDEQKDWELTREDFERVLRKVSKPLEEPPNKGQKPKAE